MAHAHPDRAVPLEIGLRNPALSGAPFALRAYQQHPVHQRFLAWILERDCTPLAFDYELTRNNVFWPAPPPESSEEN